MIDRHRDHNRRTQRRPAYTGPAPGSAWSSGAIIGMIVVVLIAVGVLLYGVNKTVVKTENTITAEPRTTGEGSSSTPHTHNRSHIESAPLQ